MPDALLDIIGVVPVQLVFAYALTKMLNIRRLSLLWVLELVFRAAYLLVFVQA